jgi:hypothetical protein
LLHRLAEVAVAHVEQVADAKEMTLARVGAPFR